MTVFDVKLSQIWHTFIIDKTRKIGHTQGRVDQRGGNLRPQGRGI